MQFLFDPWHGHDWNEYWFVTTPMGPTNAPGPDDSLFYRIYREFLWILWFCGELSLWRGTGGVVRYFIIVLIPKVTKPKHLKNFWPINLCNVLYKIVSKVWWTCARWFFLLLYLHNNMCLCQVDWWQIMPWVHLSACILSSTKFQKDPNVR
jgi:hypothetical protein